MHIRHGKASMNCFVIQETKITIKKLIPFDHPSEVQQVCSSVKNFCKSVQPIPLQNLEIKNYV